MALLGSQGIAVKCTAAIFFPYGWIRKSDGLTSHWGGRYVAGHAMATGISVDHFGRTDA